MSRTLPCTGFALLLLAGLASASDDAQRLLKQDIDRRDQERRERRWEESHSPVESSPATLPAPAPATADKPVCFNVQRITLQPDDILSRYRSNTILNAYTGRCLDTQALVQLQQQLNAEALREGLVTTRVIVPEQNLAAGELRLLVWPGRIEALRAPALRGAELRMAFPGAAGDVLQLRALEQAVDNLNRLPALRNTVALQPGKEAGSSVVAFATQRDKPWLASLNWEGSALNHNPVSTLRGSLELDSPLTLADRLILGANGTLRDAQVDSTIGTSLDYDLPFGWWHASVGADKFNYDNTLTAAFTTFKATGESQSWRAEIGRLLWRGQRDRVSLALHARQRISDNYIERVKIGVSSYRVEATGLRLDYSRVAAPWVLDTTLDSERGDTHSAAHHSPIDAAYSRLLFNSRLQYQLPRADLSATLSGQWSAAQLASSEQFALAGQVPGFSPLYLTANSGAALALQSRWTLPFMHAALQTLRPDLGLRAALAPDMGSNGDRQHLAAFTAGLTAPWTHAVAHVGASFPLSGLSSVDAPQGWQLDAALSLQW